MYIIFTFLQEEKYHKISERVFSVKSVGKSQVEQFNKSLGDNIMSNSDKLYFSLHSSHYKYFWEISTYLSGLLSLDHRAWIPAELSLFKNKFLAANYSWCMPPSSVKHSFHIYKMGTQVSIQALGIWMGEVRIHILNIGNIPLAVH